MKTMLSTFVLLLGVSTAAMAADQPDQRQYQGPPQYQPGSPDYRRGGDQIGPYAQLSDLLRADYRVVSAYQGGLILVRNDRAFVCSYVQLREGGGGNYGGRLVSQGCNEIREPRGPR